MNLNLIDKDNASLLLSAIVDSSEDAIISKDLSGIITSWNKSAERMFGYTAAEAVGQSITVLMPPDRLSEEPDIIARIKKGERVDHFETVRRHKNGALIDISLTISPVKDADGAIIGASKIARDITQSRRLQAQMARANHDLEQFAFSVSHDLQEPLRSLKIYSDLLAQRYGDKLDGEALEYLGYLSSGARRMEALVQDLRTYTQVTKIEAPVEISDASQALAFALENLSNTIAESGAAVITSPLPCVPIHAMHLQQLFQNLVGNAIKYRSPERPPVIHVAAERLNGGSVFAISDNGIGIANQYLEKIFGLFKRLHTDEEYSGTGMGLAICQRIVEQYGGRIWVESRGGQGSTFRFTVPEPRDTGR